MKPRSAIESITLTVRGLRGILDADLTGLCRVASKVLKQGANLHADRIPVDFAFRLTGGEKQEVVTDCEHLAKLKFSPRNTRTFAAHGALMAATKLNRAAAGAIGAFVASAVVMMREQPAASAEILKRPAQIDINLLKHDLAAHSRPVGSASRAYAVSNRLPGVFVCRPPNVPDNLPAAKMRARMSTRQSQGSRSGHRKTL